MAFNWFQKKQPPKEKVTPGQRGTGGGSLTEQETRDFLNGELTFLSSSNVVAAQYHPDIQSLMVEYKEGVAWIYDPVPLSMAIAFINAPSKGTFIWDAVKIRGTVHEHQVNARKLKG